MALPSGAIDAARRTELEQWAESLAGSEAAELRAAGRAIRMLCTDNEELARRLAELERGHDGDGDGDGRATDGDGDRRRERLRRQRRATALRLSLENLPRVEVRQLPWRRAAVALAAALAVAAVVTLAARAASPDLPVTGPEADVLGRRLLADAEFSVETPDAEWLLDGKPVRPTRVGGRSVWRPRQVPDGDHVLVVRRRGRFFSATTRTFRFAVDREAPVLELSRPAAVTPREPLELTGTVEPHAELRHRGEAIPLDEHGAFRIVLSRIPRRLVLEATDEGGNTSRWRVPVTVASRRPVHPIRAVHVTAYAWADDDLRREVLALVRARKLNAVELDLKDEAGEVGWKSGVALAKRNGSQRDIYDLEKAVRQFHAQGVRVIGRLVCFRDPIYAEAAWRAGRRAEVIQAPDGSPYAKYGGFTNFANARVRKYNIDLAVAATKLGVDEILYDYVRRPDGPRESMVFPGLTTTPERAIAGFLAESRAALRGSGALLGASVFGVAATRPTEVAQDIPRMARHVDYIAPMLYPSHWAPGEYDVADPNGQPYDIVRRSTADFVKQVRGTGARIVNWLQDFSLGRTYGAAEVRAQIRASRDAGVADFILWDAAVTYSADALDATAKVPVLAETTAPPKNAPMPVRLPDTQPPRRPRAAAPQPAGKQPRLELPPNELGQIPVVMHHMVRPDRVGEYDQTPREFRAELEYLWRHAYVPVNVGDLVGGALDVPAGTTPVVFTFDDATTYQIDFDASGKVKPETAVGIMLDFARTHPGFEPRGTFYVNRRPFGSDGNARRVLPWLTRNGFEIGNHTHDHIPLRGLSDDEVQRELATGAEAIHDVLSGYPIRSMSLPLGALPKNERLAVRGRWRGKRYGPYAVLLVGANPAPSPFSKAFDPTAIPRIRTSHAGWAGAVDFAFAYWMRQLERSPQTRYVSDGDADAISVPRGAEADVRPRFAARVRDSSS